ncbi:1,4-dihydroxy-2-naphthoate polyprenyltransferase [Ferrimonas marina]|uniref:1,4-dihydroxy-2-naphthoate octaprenyltransferase n=1 Tax=Ferrimonas marina TaxID=299255 RepID=A0A1M5VMJ2_9GAMM|nr:1,4-dihydroxy-2-naphthoate polyprenyltransferase [Ferrimonas marina]SHH76476.1 1,4-dihydroxy-2-naphthoate prenyltransferase [Ferrimonas marina]
MNLTYWLMAIRPRTLPAAIGPLLLGNMLAYVHGHFDTLIGISSMLCAVLLQVAVNLANDYFDFKSGVDTHERVGPTRVTQSGLLSPIAVRNAMIGTLVAAVAVGAYLIYVGGWPVAAMAVFAVLGALCYSGGPYPLASHGLGEVAAFIYFGLLAVVGAYFIQVGQTNLDAWLLAATVGCFNAAIMLVNNTRDIRTDREANKRTLAVRIGLENARGLYRVLVVAPFLVLVLMWLLGDLPGLVPLLGCCAFPMARLLAARFAQVEGAELNPLLGRTAQLTMLYSLLVSLALPLAQLT